MNPMVGLVDENSTILDFSGPILAEVVVAVSCEASLLGGVTAVKSPEAIGFVRSILLEVALISPEQMIAAFVVILVEEVECVEETSIC
jgi:hypothetical protein